MKRTSEELMTYLDNLVETYNKTSFIKDDPISIPKKFRKKQDKEIMGFWVAMLSWGQRITIINKANELVKLMDNAPYDFILNHEEKDRKIFADFKHRTFQYTDTLYFLSFFQAYYKKHKSLETAFTSGMHEDDVNVENGIKQFHDTFFSLDYAPQRTRKHVSTPTRNSKCKRINMFLRWMVRKDKNKVDFGIWKNIKTSQLLIPLDVHVERVGRALGLIERKQNDWKTVLELTERLREFCPEDPVKYDFALFGLGVLKKKGVLESIKNA